ncbi:MAG: glutathione S-transferase N-terminal domain-containing protein [Proteobacteria bacterium]|jgi:glutathione S-transferase|nr:glutathione S-transferase N-terminal domain-containing protein [Pseudomonadota bacterium]MDA1136240.1 glutathione S-transferase N-terminal domain-containing protein [Pseudomonadota bacterium]
MYKLSFSPASPYVRKVRMAAFKAGLDKKLELITANTQDEKDDIRSLNPLGKIPIVTKPDGSSLFDSRVIIDHFNRVGGGLIPDNGDDRDTVLTRAALVEGLIDASLLIVYSDRYAGGETPSKVWADLQKGKIDRTLDFLENDLTNWSNPIGFDLANIGLATALGYLIFREVRDWKTNRPKMQEWYQNIGSNLPGFDETKPYSA